MRQAIILLSYPIFLFIFKNNFNRAIHLLNGFCLIVKKNPGVLMLNLNTCAIGVFFILYEMYFWGIFNYFVIFNYV